MPYKFTAPAPVSCVCLPCLCPILTAHIDPNGLSPRQIKSDSDDDDLPNVTLDSVNETGSTALSIARAVQEWVYSFFFSWTHAGNPGADFFFFANFKAINEMWISAMSWVGVMTTRCSEVCGFGFCVLYQWPVLNLVTWKFQFVPLVRYCQCWGKQIYANYCYFALLLSQIVNNDSTAELFIKISSTLHCIKGKKQLTEIMHET